MVELPTGEASRGLGVGRARYRLPVWLQKDPEGPATPETRFATMIDDFEARASSP